MRLKLFAANFFFMLLWPLCTVKAQEAGQATGAAQGFGNLISTGVNKVIEFLAPIGNLFGEAAGFRIGGTTGTAIITLIVAKLVEDKAPSWVKWVLYITGGTDWHGNNNRFDTFFGMYGLEHNAYPILVN